MNSKLPIGPPNVVVILQLMGEQQVVVVEVQGARCCAPAPGPARCQLDELDLEFKEKYRSCKVLGPFCCQEAQRYRLKFNGVLAVAGCVHALNQMTVFHRVLVRFWLSFAATP